MAVIQKQGVTDQVVNYLKEQISTGIWLPGDKIASENKLTEELQVSRASVRYAIQQLVAVGILESFQGKGTFVRAVPVKSIKNKLNSLYQENKDMRDMLELRMVIEVESCRLVVDRITDCELTQLQEYLTNMKKDLHKSELFVKSDFGFHKVINKATRNKLLIQSFQLAAAEAEIFQRQNNTEYLVEKAVFYHQKIYESLKERDGEAAANQMRNHLQIVNNEYYKLIDEEE